MEQKSDLSGYWKKTKDLFRPDKIVRELEEIDFAALRARGITALLLDIDDTLIPKEVNAVYPKVFEWVYARKQEGFRLCLTSNSRHPLRVKSIGDSLGLPAISFGFKPLPFVFWKSLELLQAKAEETAMIGDQLFMDILGAKLLNIYSIFINHQKAETIIFRQWMRQAEQWVLAKLKP